MPLFTTTLTSHSPSSFRVQQVAGMFDLPYNPNPTTTISADLPGPDEPWTIGAIVGPSGSGKTSLARQAYDAPPPEKPGMKRPLPAESRDSSSLITTFDWPTDLAVVDAFPPHLPTKTITATLAAVGLASPPAWVRPYHTLSTGQRFRCDLARALLLPQSLIAFDEFTSVVDRQVARFASAALSRLLRSRPRNSSSTLSSPASTPAPQASSLLFPTRFVAVSCHYDILDWLEVDWYLDLATGKLARGRLQRPRLQLHLHRCHQNLWPLFSRHHYLSSALNPSSRCYLALWENRPIAFCATMPMLGRPNMRRVHRLVVLPDYQGLGVGPATLNAVAHHETYSPQPSPILRIITSHPALVRHLARSTRWRLVRLTKCGQPHRGFLARTGRKIGSPARITLSFQYLPPQPS